MRVFATSSLVLVLAAAAAGAHEVSQTVTRGSAVVIELKESGDLPFGGEAYEIYRKGEDKPFQTGKTDALGRIVFLPDRQAAWRVRAFSEDGHGTDFTIDAGPAEAAGTAQGPAADYMSLSKIVFGIVMILLVFLIVLRVIKRRAG